MIAGGLAGAIINGLFDLLFPKKGDSVIDAYFKGLEKIVRQELQASVIDQITGTLTSLRSELENVYGPARLRHDLSKPSDRQYLFDQLSRYESTFFLGSGGMLGTLQNEKYKLSAFPVFLLGAGLHLAILQEMANVDPGNDAADFNPLESSYGQPKTGSVARYAKQYADFADTTWPLIRSQREGHISYQTEIKPIFRHHTWYGFFVDDLEGDTKHAYTKYIQEYDKNGNAHYTAGHGPDDVKAAMKTYTAARVKDLDNSLPERASVVTGWRKLIEQPLNLKTG